MHEQKKRLVKSRTYPAAAARIAELTTIRGMTAEMLGRNAEASEGTIQNIFNGKRAYIATLTRVAEALDFPVEFLIDGWRSDDDYRRELHGAQELSGKDFKWTLMIDIDRDFDMFDETDELAAFVRRLKAFCELEGNIQIRGIFRHSVRLELGMAADDIERLAVIFVDEGLHDLSVFAITFKSWLNSHMMPKLAAIIASRMEGEAADAARVASFLANPSPSSFKYRSDGDWDTSLIATSLEEGLSLELRFARIRAPHTNG